MSPRMRAQGDPVLLIHGFASNHAVNWVNTLWVKTLTHAGYRAIALDNRGHGQSEKLYDPAAYTPTVMAEDARRLLDHLGIERADVMGYSMGARIAATLALDPSRARALAPARRARHPSRRGRGPAARHRRCHGGALAGCAHRPDQRMFRAFAEQTKSDLKALAACMRGSRQNLSRAEVAPIRADLVGRHQGPHRRLARGAGRLMPNARALDIPNRDQTSRSAT